MPTASRYRHESPGDGQLAHEVERSLRYAFSLPVSTVIVGMESVMQLEQNLKIAESYTPMTDAERLAFFRDILPLVRPEKNALEKQPVWENQSNG